MLNKNFASLPIASAGRWAAAVLILTNASILYAQQMPRQMHPEKSSVPSTVELPLNVTGHVPVIEAKINGKGPYRFALDTGFGGMISVTSELATELNLAVVGRARAGDPSGRNPVEIRLFKADFAEVGVAKLTGVIVSERSRRGPIDTDGVIGLNLFHGALVKLDYPGGKFLLSPGSLSKTEGIPYTDERGVPKIAIEAAGTKTDVDIDSGSLAEISLPLALGKTLPLAGEPRVVGRGRTMDGEFEIFGAALKGDVRVSNIVVKNPNLDMISVFPHGNLGYRFLKRSAVTFDPANRRVKFEETNAK